MCVVTALFVIQAWRRLGGSFARKLTLASLVWLFYAGGVVSANLIISTGHQYWHMCTASSFFAGFMVQNYWLRTARLVESFDEKTRQLLEEQLLT